MRGIYLNNARENLFHAFDLLIESYERKIRQGYGYEVLEEYREDYCKDMIRQCAEAQVKIIELIEILGKLP